MMERSRDADAVGEHLRNFYPNDFAGDKLQVIHIGRDGEVSNRDLERARNVVKSIDSDDSTVNAVVSVMMLREGWDVRNVTVVLGAAPVHVQRKHSAGAGHRARAGGSCFLAMLAMKNGWTS